MATVAIVVGVLVGWASAATWGKSSGNVWLTRGLGIIGGLVGAYLAGSIGSGDPVGTAIWAWAGALVLCDLVSLLMSGQHD